MEKPSLEEVRAHFKDAKVIRTSTLKPKKLFKIKAKNINWNDIDEDYEYNDAKEGTWTVWSYDKGYAKILEYKKPTPSELVDHFKAAKIVKDHKGFRCKYIPLSEDLFLDGGGRYFARVPFTEYTFNFWDSEHGYAEIVEKIEEGEVLKREPYERVALTDTGETMAANFGYSPQAMRLGMKLQNQSFDKVVEETLENIKNLLVVKGKEYRRNNNPFHNFDVGAAKEGKIREEILHGFRLKHEISVGDFRNDIAKGILPTKAKVVEKFDDILVFYLIEKASMLDRIDNQKEE